MAARTHRELLDDLIRKLEVDEQPFYQTQAARSYWGWYFASIATVLLSVAAAIAAELMSGKEFDAWGKPLLTILPIIGTAIAAISHLCKFREKEALREAGRIEVEDIILNAKSLSAAATDESSAQRAFHEVRQRAYELERQQHNLDVALRSHRQPET
jgi:hypothetical protein